MTLDEAEPAPPGVRQRFALAPWASALLLGYALLLLLPGLGSTRALTYHEALAAQPAREMLDGGHWIIPRFAGEARLEKPPTMGWLIAASMAIGGRDEFWARLPAALAAVLCAWIAAAMTARWHGSRAGLLAGLLGTTSFWLLMQGRLAEADMPLTACVTGAMACLGRVAAPSPLGRDRRAWVRWCFFACVGLAGLLKGPVGPAMVALTVLAMALTGERRSLAWLLAAPGPWALLAAMLLAWPVAAWQAHPPIVQTWREQILGRVAGDLGGAEPWWFYAWNAPMMLLPWTALTALGLADAARRRRLWTPAARWLWCWFVPGLLMLSLSAWKHKHYVLPLLPAALPATAGGLLVLRRFADRQARPRPLLTAAIAGAACIIGAAALLLLKPRGATPIAGTLMILGAGSAAVLWLEHRRLRGLRTAGIFVVAFAVASAALAWVVPAFDGYRDNRDFAARINDLAPPGQTLRLAGLGYAQIAFYLRPPLARVDGADVAARLRDLPETPLYLVTRRSLIPALRAAGAVQPLLESATARRYERDEDRLVFLRLDPASDARPRATDPPATRTVQPPQAARTQ